MANVLRLQDLWVLHTLRPSLSIFVLYLIKRLRAFVGLCFIRVPLLVFGFSIDVLHYFIGL